MSSKVSSIFVLCGVLLVTCVVFLSCLKNDFVETWDDSLVLTANESIRSLNVGSVLKIFSAANNSEIPVYIPLTLLSYSIEYKYFGYNPFIYHLTNLFLHLAVIASIFFLVRKIGFSVGAAALASLLYGIHPMHVESVAWITERKDVFYSLFYVLALSCYVEYVRTANKIPYLLTIFWGLLSVLSKPMALSLPLMLFVFDWWFKRKLSARVFIEKIPHFLYMAAIAWLTYTKYMKPLSTEWWEKILIWVWSFIFYIKKFIFPAELLPHYQLPEPVVWFHPVYLGSLCLFIIFLYAIVRFRQNRLFTFAWLYYFISIFFILRFENVVKVGNLSIVADRFMYLPSLGFCILFGVCADRFITFANKQFLWKKVVLLVSVCFIFLVLANKTVLLTKIWQNDISLWSYLVDKSPNDPLAYINRALGYKLARQYELAVADNSRAISLNPNYYISFRNPEGELAKRRDDINLALANNPFLVVAYRNRGLIYKEMGRNDLAINDFNRVLEINPGDSEIISSRAAMMGLDKF